MPFVCLLFLWICFKQIFFSPAWTAFFRGHFDFHFCYASFSSIGRVQTSGCLAALVPFRRISVGMCMRCVIVYTLPMLIVHMKHLTAFHKQSAELIKSCRNEHVCNEWGLALGFAPHFTKWTKTNGKKERKIDDVCRSVPWVLLNGFD